jgi:hypothetical protein
MKKVSTAAVKQSFSQQKLTIGLDLGLHNSGRTTVTTAA